MLEILLVIETRIYYNLEIELNGNACPVPSLVELTIGTQPVTTMSLGKIFTYLNFT